MAAPCTVLSTMILHYQYSTTTFVFCTTTVVRPIVVINTWYDTVYFIFSVVAQHTRNHSVTKERAVHGNYLVEPCDAHGLRTQ